ncbi:MAG: thiamine pyrophosphate-dependent enzyme [Puia sp.]
MAKVSLAFTGEGGTSEGDFHEALNLAAVWICLSYLLLKTTDTVLSTPVREQFRSKRLADKGIGYGMESVQIDGKISWTFTTPCVAFVNFVSANRNLTWLSA